MNTFKVGDKVRIKKNLTYGAYGRFVFVDSMLPYKGKSAKITGKPYNGGYMLDVDKGEWVWSDEMLEDAEKKEGVKMFKVGDKVRIKKGAPTHCIGNYDDYADKIATIKATIYLTDRYCYRLDIDNEFWSWTDDQLAPVKKKVDDEETIFIKSDGKVVIACKGKEKGVAKCHPDDEFDLETGAKIAIERLLHLVKPHLEDICGTYFGEFGKKTGLTDAFGAKLCIGDVVKEVFIGGVERLNYVVEDSEDAFCMGLAAYTNANGAYKNGKHTSVVIKIKDHADIKNGEKYGIIKAVLE